MRSALNNILFNLIRKKARKQENKCKNLLALERSWIGNIILFDKKSS